jgi:hypothetical protein
MRMAGAMAPATPPATGMGIIIMDMNGPLCDLLLLVFVLFCVETTTAALLLLAPISIDAIYR